MRNLTSRIGNNKNQSKGLRDALLLMILIVGTSFASDAYISNNKLCIAVITSLVLSASLTACALPRLRALKLNQIIRKEGPKAHHLKAGTPTMGGFLIVLIGLIIGNLYTIDNAQYQKIAALSFLTLCFMCIGSLDDWQSLTLKRNTGLSPKGKIILQSISGVIFLLWTSSQEWINSKIYLFSELSIDIGIIIWPLALFVLLAESNSTNLTDGLDGLASGCGSLVFTGLAIQLILRGNEGDVGIAIFCMAMAGAWLGFLLHNRKPAKIFMGDTGSLAMGAALSGVSLLSNSLWPLLIMGGVFFLESISVIIQVWVYKITKKFFDEGKRIFLMAPIHHHYELAGNDEQAIVRSFWLVTLSLVVLGLLVRPTPTL